MNAMLDSMTTMVLSLTTIVFNIVVAVATSVTAWWAIKKTRLFREERPFLKVTQKVSVRRISENLVHVHTAAIIQNLSKVKIEPSRGCCILHGIPRMPDDAARKSDSDDFMVQIDKKGWAEKGFLEPGETHKAFFDFIVSNEYLAFRSYVFIQNPENEKTGWNDVEIVDNLKEVYDA